MESEDGVWEEEEDDEEDADREDSRIKSVSVGRESVDSERGPVVEGGLAIRDWDMSHAEGTGGFSSST